MMSFVRTLLNRIRTLFDWWPKGWFPGPIIKWRNYSSGVTLEGDTALINGELDALCLRVDRIPERLALGVAVEGGPFTFSDHPERKPFVSLCIQRQGDNWSAKNEYQHYRWYARATLSLTEGLHGVVISLEPEEWFSVFGGKGEDNQALFRRAIEDPRFLYITFGGPGGRMHGIKGKGSVCFKVEGLS